MYRVIYQAPSKIPSFLMALGTKGKEIQQELSTELRLVVE